MSKKGKPPELPPQLPMPGHKKRQTSKPLPPLPPSPKPKATAKPADPARTPVATPDTERAAPRPKSKGARRKISFEGQSEPAAKADAKPEDNPMAGKSHLGFQSKPEPPAPPKTGLEKKRISFESASEAPKAKKKSISFAGKSEAPSKKKISFEPGHEAGDNPLPKLDPPTGVPSRASKPVPDPVPDVEPPAPEAPKSRATRTKVIKKKDAAQSAPPPKDDTVLEPLSMPKTGTAPADDPWDTVAEEPPAKAEEEAPGDLSLDALSTAFAEPEPDAPANPEEVASDEWINEGAELEDPFPEPVAEPEPAVSRNPAGDEWDNLPEPDPEPEPEPVEAAPVMPQLDWGGATTALQEVGVAMAKAERPVIPEPEVEPDDEEPQSPLTGDEHRIGQDPVPEVVEAKPFEAVRVHIPKPSRAEAVPPPRTSPDELIPVDDIGFLAELRRLERMNRNRPRIGRNQRLSQEMAEFGQDPFLHFPAADLAPRPENRDKTQIRARFLGFFGPHGALPLNTTEEVLRWVHHGDRAYVRFTDIFASRFIQMFFRAFSDSRPIAQFDRPDDDRFQGYLRALGGIATDSFQGRDTVHDTTKLPLIPLYMHRIKSGVRLKQMLVYHLGTEVEVEELVPSWLDFEPDALSRLGSRGSTLGQDLLLGNRARTVTEKICVHLRAKDLETYKQYLPQGKRHNELQDIVFWYTGQRFEVDVALWLPSGEVEPAKLGESAALGWMAALAPPDPEAPQEMIRATTFRLDPTHDETAAAA